MSLRILSTRAIKPASKLAATQLSLRSIPIGVRHYSAPVEPKAKASSIIDSLPGNGILSKTGILATGIAGSVYAISSGFYVVNEETLLVISFGGVCILVSKLLAPLYTDFAKDRIAKITSILNNSKLKHIDSINSRIDEVSKLKDIKPITNALFDVSKETLELEKNNFELKQKINILNEAKSVLDSWVKYENSIKLLEHQQLSSSVIKSVSSKLDDKTFQNQILSQSVQEVEKIFASH
ncbi:F1F0 ATP synthase subunit 4 [Ascoidea rubescens DSM 1968]|uniref:ATP synthase subunit 4 n=1 Tax=Ascoidea rubescens DSM 1968 TaxID=1344418 RepID=A0A1D2V8H0_9ASCO|nr:subunit B of the stator stalk of mitochondrial F1F0 ATP synthase [Ascoidea rubescens DSM 1968]ODV57949.1 subunit B of the stator stalk of mitochondrial F1F0 ATP synthase [Ascoidea rubescens DSM 1968]